MRKGSDPTVETRAARKQREADESVIRQARLASANKRELVALDRIDKKILNALQVNNQLTNLALAEEVGVSPPSCLRRLRRLRKSKVITNDVSLIDERYAGRKLSILVEVALERERPDLMDVFKRSMMSAPEVTQCYVVTGDADFILLLQLADIEAYDEFVQRVFYTNPNIKKFRTLIVMNRVKFETRLLLDEAGGADER
jgi:Lrp/AsnC family leucine-responsive transcriptional regulator